jgi:hypothetical protein
MRTNARTRKIHLAAWTLVVPCLIIGVTSGASAFPQDGLGTAASEVRARYGTLPLMFEANQGQTDSNVLFLARGPGYNLFLTADRAVLALQDFQASGRLGSGKAASHGKQPGTDDAVLAMKLVGANSKATIAGVDELPGKSNYFIGSDPSNWRSDVPNFGKVKYENAYPGIDLVYYGRQGQLEYDFVVSPGADPGSIRLALDGAGSGEGKPELQLASDGDLIVKCGEGAMRFHKPVVYQTAHNGQRTFVEGRYRLAGHQVSLEVSKYDRRRPLVIDPVLTYSTFLGGTGPDIAYGIAADDAGDAYVAGITGSLNFPVKSALQTTENGQSNAFVAKINPSGTGLVYSTYVGGSGADSASAIALDSLGNVYITGSTSSQNFPVTAKVFQSTLAGTINAFVAKLSASGSALTYATYLGGSATDDGQGIAVGVSGNVYITGSTTSPNFPTLNALQTGNAQCSVVDMVETCSADAFVAELNPTASALVYSTYLGGSSTDSGQAIAVNAQGEAVVAGYTYSSDFPTQNPLQPTSGGGVDAFVTALDASGLTLAFSTYLGGTGQDQAFGLALDAAQNIYITGQTQSSDFPTTPGAFQGAGAYGGAGDAFLTKLSGTGNALLSSTFIGGSALDQGNGVAVDSAGNVVVVGVTQSTDFPTSDALQNVLGLSGAGNCATSANPTNVCSDAFIARLNASGQISYSTYLGGTGEDFAQAVAMDSTGTPYVAGSTASSNFPIIGGALQSAYAGGSNGNAFIAKIESSDGPGAALTPQELNFGNEALNVASTAQTVTLTNEGSLPLEITSIEASGNYAASSTCGATLSAGGGSCTISITFTPTTAGSSTEQITINDNAANSPQLVAVTGNGVNGGSGTLTLSPKSLVFPVQAVGTTSPPQVVQVINASQTAITLTGITIGGDFAETNNCGVQPNVLNAAAVLNAGASCSVTVTFAPTASGSRTSTLTITENASSGSQAVTVTGTGGGLFVLSANARSNNIVIGTKSTTFTITASAAASFTSTIALSCSSGATCSFNPATITAGQSTIMTVSGLSAGTANPFNLTVTGTAGANTSTLELSIFLQDFMVTATPLLTNVNAGQTTTYSVTVTGINGFNGIVLLSVSSILPSETDAYWSPTSAITVTPSSTGTATLSLTTTTQQTTARGWPRRRPPGGGDFLQRGIGILAAGLIVLLTAVLAANRRRYGFPIRTRYLAGVLAILILTMGTISCENYGYNVIGTPNIVGTPTGTYVITIEGTLGTNSTVIHTYSVNLSVAPG